MNREVFGTSVQGASHIRTGKECQDSLKKVEVDEHTVILTVADGHGSESCPYSKTGSYVAVNVFCKIMGEYIENFEHDTETLLTFLKREGDTKIAQAIDMEWKRRILKIHSNYKREVTYDADGNKNKKEIYKLYGSTLVGMVLTETYLFAFQLGDGDMIMVSEAGVQNILDSDKILGIETHSLSKEGAWKKAITDVRKFEQSADLPVMFMLSTDGLANSYKNESEFHKTCTDYYQLIKEHGAGSVSEHLKEWLAETSELGCGDDITALFAYFDKESEECSNK